MTEKICSVDGCARSAHWKDHGHLGMCSAHYQRLRIHGDVEVNRKAGPRTPAFKECSVEGCDKNAARAANGKRGMCQMHYARVKKHGDPHMVKKPESPAKDWLERHVDHSGDDCLTWPFAIGKDGYGRIHRENNGSLTTASHLMCEKAHGPKPSKRHEAAHSCGKGHEGCVSPRHVYWALPKENQADRVKHGTSNRGTQQHSARMSEDDIREIRTLAATMRVKDIAQKFGLHQSYVSQIISRKRWAWLPD